jgi:Kef-type K+ transport system membrane component KefB
MVALTILIFLVIRSYGELLEAPPPDTTESVTGSARAGDSFLRVLVALTAIVVVGQVLARLFAYVSQPPVIGEVAAGILLGPSLLGPDISALVLPRSVAPFLGVIAQLGVVLYMFLVGLDLNPALLKQRSQATVAASYAGMLFPFVLGAGLALFLYPRLSHSDVPFTSFALFMAVAMSITAFPVLARILTDYRMTRTPLGVIALGCAAIGDLTAWCLLAFVVGVAKAQVGEGLLVAVGAMAFVAFMFLAARPFLTRMARQWGERTHSPVQATVIFVALLLSALAAEAIGIHAIFGAFLLGAMIPHDSTAARALTRQLEPVVTILLLPAFFAFTGMRTRIDLLTELSHWLICGLIVLTATAGKFGGTFAAARITGLSRRNAAMLGTLMNTRGLMELIVLNVGLDLKVISPTIFSMMVLMALVTTTLTSPVLRLLQAYKPPGEEPDMAAEFRPEPQGEKEGLKASVDHTENVAEGPTAGCT